MVSLKFPPDKPLCMMADPTPCCREGCFRSGLPNVTGWLAQELNLFGFHAQILIDHRP